MFFLSVGRKTIIFFDFFFLCENVCDYISVPSTVGHGWVSEARGDSDGKDVLNPAIPNVGEVNFWYST